MGNIFREFGASSRTCQNPPCSKPWAIAQGFCSKSTDFGPLEILAKCSRTSPYEVRNPFPSIWSMFVGSLGRVLELVEIRHVQNHGLWPRVFAQNRPISVHWKFLQNLHEQTQLQQTKYEVRNPFPSIWATFLGSSGEFKNCHNSPCSKLWAIAQGFCSKSVDLGTLQILAKSSRTTPCDVGNPVPNIWAKFLGSLGRVQELPKFAMFKTMGYSPGFLLKIGRFRPIENSCQIFTNNPGRR